MLGSSTSLKSFSHVDGEYCTHELSAGSAHTHTNKESCTPAWPGAASCPGRRSRAMAWPPWSQFVSFSSRANLRRLLTLVTCNRVVGHKTTKGETETGKNNRLRLAAPPHFRCYSAQHQGRQPLAPALAELTLAPLWQPMLRGGSSSAHASDPAPASSYSLGGAVHAAAPFSHAHLLLPAPLEVVSRSQEIHTTADVHRCAEAVSG
jgi:hypothetical protein